MVPLTPATGAPLLAPTGALDVTAPCADLDEAIEVVDGHSAGS